MKRLKPSDSSVATVKTMRLPKGKNDKLLFNYNLINVDDFIA